MVATQVTAVTAPDTTSRDMTLEQHDEWAIQRRYMTLETLAPSSDTPPVSLPPVAI